MYTMRRTRVFPNVTRSTKLRGTQRSPELGFRSTELRVQKYIIFLALLESDFLALRRLANG